MPVIFPLFVTSSLLCARGVRPAIFFFPHSAFFSCIRPILADRKTPPLILRITPTSSRHQNRRRHLCRRLSPSISGGLYPPLILFVASQESNSLQRQAILVLVGHLVVILLPHFDELIAINKPDKLIITGSSVAGI